MYGKSLRMRLISLCLSAVAVMAVGCHSATALSPQMEAKAIGLEGKGDWRGLAAFANQAIEQYPNDGEAWFYAAAAANGLGNTAAARTDLENVERCGPAALKSVAQSMLAQLQPASSYARSQVAAKVQPSSVPDISVGSIAALTAQARRNWERDAIPIMVIVMGSGNSYSTVVNYYSPSTRRGLSVRQGANGSGMQRIEQPDYGTTALPENFKSLADAVAVARKHGLSGRLDRAFLSWAEDISGPNNLTWDMAFGIQSDAARVIANDMSGSRMNDLLTAANGGSKSAQYDLGTAYAAGVGGKEDPGKAVYWLQKAAAQGSRRAENRLGQDYQSGYGVTANPQQAAYWYGKAASAGFGPAEYNLGLLYEKGVGVARDWKSAEQWFNLALRQGVQQATLELDEMRSATERESGGATPAQMQAADALAERIAREYCASGGQNPVLALDKRTPDEVDCVYPGKNFSTNGMLPGKQIGSPASLQLEGLPSWYKFYTCSASDWNSSTASIDLSCTR
jgi:TPR repeat protein